MVDSSDAAVTSLHMPRALVLGIACALMAAALTLLVLPLPGLAMLYPATCAVGLSFGAINAIAPATLSDIFGLPNLAKIYSAAFLGMAAGSEVFAAATTTALFNAARARHRMPEGDPSCPYADCFSDTLAIAAVACAFAALVCVALAWRTAPLYRKRVP